MTTEIPQETDDDYCVTACFRVGEVFVGIATPANPREPSDPPRMRSMGYHHTVRFALSVEGLAKAQDFYIHCMADLARAATLAEPVLLASELDRR